MLAPTDHADRRVLLVEDEEMDAMIVQEILQGVGYRAQVQGKNLILNVGYSNPVQIDPPEGVQFAVEANTNVAIAGIDKEVVGNTAARIRAVRPPEPYKGKGIRYAGELVRRKAGKAGKK